MPPKKNPPQNDMDLYGFVSPALRALRDKPNKTPEEWTQLRAIEAARRRNDSGIQVDTPARAEQNFGRPTPAFRNNNPGNLEIRDWQIGATKKGGERFASFPSPEIGYLNLVNSMRRYQQEGATVESFYNSYAPPHENPTPELIDRFTKRFGVTPQTPLRYIDPRELADYMARRESSTRVTRNGGDR